MQAARANTSTSSLPSSSFSRWLYALPSVVNHVPQGSSCVLRFSGSPSILKKEREAKMTRVWRGTTRPTRCGGGRLLRGGSCMNSLVSSGPRRSSPRPSHFCFSLFIYIWEGASTLGGSGRLLRGGSWLMHELVGVIWAPITMHQARSTWRISRTTSLSALFQSSIWQTSYE